MSPCGSEIPPVVDAEVGEEEALAKEVLAFTHFEGLLGW